MACARNINITSPDMKSHIIDLSRTIRSIMLYLYIMLYKYLKHYLWFKMSQVFPV